LRTLGDEEPSLGTPERQAGSWRGLYQLGNDDREANSADDEPSLGASEPAWYGINSFKAQAFARQRPDLFEGSQTERTRQTSQFGWSGGSGDDREWECDDEGAIDCDLEPDSDAEPMACVFTCMEKHLLMRLRQDLLQRNEVFQDACSTTL
jgi:hypothetical protein